MKVGETYVTLCELPGYDRPNDDDVRLPSGREFKAVKFDEIVDCETGEVFGLPRLHAANPFWYFVVKGHPRYTDVVTLVQLAREVVRCNEGLMLADLFAIAIDACPRQSFSYNTFAAVLSTIPNIELRQDGVPVQGTCHNTRYNTYHLVRKRAA